MSASASDVTQGRVVNISIASTQLTLVADESFSFSAGEDISGFDLATATTTQHIPANADPQISFDLHLEKADQTGLEELGVIDSSGQYQFSSSSREVATVTVEYLAGDSGTVEVTHEFSDVLFELGSIDDSQPVDMGVTGYINGSIELAVNKTTA